MKKYILSLSILFFMSNAYAGRVNTANYWKCSSKRGGSWTFGHAPSACKASSFISDNLVNSKYKRFIFDERKNRNDERVRYLTEAYSLLNEASRYYLKKRKPNVSSTELRYWQRAILAKAHQESFITHYRDGSDRVLRMMRGDYGHGHGMMQIDDRWHFAQVKSGKAADLMDNIFYGFDIFYAAWQKAASKRCVSDYYSRVRSAYGIYNGGDGAACRFLNPNHRWARNDKNFKQKFDQQAWKRYVSSSEDVKPIDVACLANKTNSCSVTASTPPSTPPVRRPANQTQQASILKYRGLLCALDDNMYKCLAQPEFRYCLVNKYNLVNEVKLSFFTKKVELLQKEDVCNLSVPNLDIIAQVGSFIELKKNINIRKTPGGRLLSSSRKGEKYQVLNSYITGRNKARYYLIKRGRHTGYVYAGDKDSYSQWTQKTTSASSLLIPVKESLVQIATSATNFRATPGGRKIGVVPGKTQLEVLDTVIVSSTRKIYIKVQYRGQTGYLYSGQASPRYSVNKWVRILK